METCPCRELRASPRKGRFAPNAHPAGFPTLHLCKRSTLDRNHPRPKGSEGRSYRFPLPSERVGSLFVKGRDERTTSALDSVPP